MELQYNITYRKKDKGWQFIISYKTEKIAKWKQKSKQGFKSKIDAKKASDKLLVALKEDIENNSIYQGDLNDVTLIEFYNIYKNDNELYFSGSTLNNLKYTINVFEELWDVKLKNITTRDIQLIITGLYKSGKSDNTIKTRLAYLNMVLNSAVNKYKIIKFSPSADVKIKNDTTEVERRALEDEEIQQLLNRLEFDKKNYYVIALIAVTTGLRIGEILGITLADIDFSSKQIKINKQFKRIDNNLYGLGPLKSKNSNRTIPVPQKTLDVVLDYANTHTPAGDGRIFNFGTKRSFQTVMNRRMKVLGFDICLHELRHTYATKLIASGVDFKTAAAILGHDVKETMKTYSHVTDDMKRKAAGIILEEFNFD